METELIDTHQKALRINLDPTKYGTFAEIGAGQEVARWFFRVGGASGTIAKSISAYDMVVSDAIYGHSDRYVSRQRLQTMLEYEFNLMRERLDCKRGESTRFFVASVWGLDVYMVNMTTGRPGGRRTRSKGPGAEHLPFNPAGSPARIFPFPGYVASES